MPAPHERDGSVLSRARSLAVHAVRHKLALVRLSSRASIVNMWTTPVHNVSSPVTVVRVSIRIRVAAATLPPVVQPLAIVHVAVPPHHDAMAVALAVAQLPRVHGAVVKQLFAATWRGIGGAGSVVCLHGGLCIIGSSPV